MVKTKDKIKICRKYRVYLELIFIVGNCVMLQKQFYEICRKLNISVSDYQTRKVLNDLEKAQIIKKQKFLYSKNNLIVLRKFAIRFLLNKDYSHQVSSLPKNIDRRAIQSVFKSDIIIRIIDRCDLYDWDNFLDKMYDLNSSLLYNKYKGIYYHEMLIKKNNLSIQNQELYLRACENHDRILLNLKRHKYNEDNYINNSDNSYTNSNLQIKKSSNINLENLTMDTLINSNVHIQTISDLIDIKIVEVLIMDINNTQNINKIIQNIISSCIVMCNIFKDSNIEFRFKLVTWDEAAKDNIKSKLGKVDNFEEINYIRKKISSYKIDGRNILLDLGIDINDIRISIGHLDFYSKYLDNKKNYNY